MIISRPKAVFFKWPSKFMIAVEKTIGWLARAVQLTAVFSLYSAYCIEIWYHVC